MLLWLLIGHKLPRLTLLIVFQIVKLPVIYFAYHHHDLGSYDAWLIYRNIFIALRIADYLLALLALNESICTEYHAIALGLEAWLGSQLIVLAIAVNNPNFWSRGESISNFIYLISCLIFIKLLVRNAHE